MRSDRFTLSPSLMLALLPCLALVPLSGCGGSDSSASATAQLAPANQVQGIQRIGENQAKHQADIKKGVRPRR